MELFENWEKTYTPVPQGFENIILREPIGYYWKPCTDWSKPQKCSGKYFWRLWDPWNSKKLGRSVFVLQMDGGGLVLWLSWIDDCLCVESRKNVVKSKDEMLRRFDCDDVGEVKEYLGCKVDIDEKIMHYGSHSPWYYKDLLMSFSFLIQEEFKIFWQQQNQLQYLK